MCLEENIYGQGDYFRWGDQKSLPELSELELT